AAKLLQFSQSGTGNPWQIATTGNAGLDIRALGGYINIANTSGKIYLDTTGNVGIGTTAPTSALHVSKADATIYSQGTTKADITASLTSASNLAPQLLLNKAGTSGLPAANDDLGHIQFYGSDSTFAWQHSARISAQIEGTPTDTVMPTSLQFYTRPITASATPQERLRITAAGNVGIGATAPNYKLEVAGTIATTSGGVRFPDSTTQTTSAKQVLSGCVAASIPASTTQFGTFGGSSTSGTEVNRQIVLPFGGTLEKLYVITSGVQPGTGALTITLRKNAADTSVTVTLAASAAAGTYSDVVNSVSAAAGDTISLQFANAASAPTGNVGCYSMMLTPN
ncbi:MAG: hypothetical protein AABZ31_12100, partial [Bdellovibrionota bacterium]